MTAKEITLIVSDRMDRNKKEGRDEANSIRLAKVAREYLKLDEHVSVFQKIKGGKQQSPFQLKILQAFSSDIQGLKEKEVPADDLKCIGFVTSSTFKKICSNGTSNVVQIVSALDSTIIGADPEFLLFDANGELVEANRVMSKAGLMGSDGPMAEIRPQPASTPAELVENIRSILTNTNVTKAIQNYKWLAACYHKNSKRDYCVGGHLHIGNPPQIMKLEREKREDLYYVVNKIVDELLSVPMMRVDGKKEGSARRIGAMYKFGTLGCLRTDWDRLEHRTLSGLWLMHPQLSEMVVGTAKAITDSAFKLAIDKGLTSEFILPAKFHRQNLYSKNFDEWNSIPLAKEMACTTPTPVVRELLDKSASAAVTHKYLDEWLAKMKGLPAYNRYSSCINKLHKLLGRPAKFFADCNRNLQENWYNEKSLL